MSEEVLSCAKNVDGQAGLMVNPMYYYVYILRSIKYPQTIYIGYTTDIKKRLQTHNYGGSIHTKKDMPWEIVICLSFKEMICAKKFEKYLKTQSGRAFIKKRFL